ncbi:MAG: adenylyltransferase/cytidyltransferase family protein [Selenomonadaceae bacterium]|nr:adenylyltransferase/cytidyltransferase family protein [Selenomonadaceae bacterium]
MRKDKKFLNQIFDNKLFDFCNDFKSVEDMSDAFFLPESYEDMKGIIQFKDYTSNAVNMRNGNRVTTDQPDKYKRAVFFVGVSTTVGLGADDAHTFESYLQRKFNELIPNEEFIVYNYGRYAGGMRGLSRLLVLLSTLPLKTGDIVFFWNYQPVISGLPYCDLSLMARRPHNYGEIFSDRTHFSANGNKMIADGLFEFLKQHNFFKDATMKVTRQGAKPLPTQNIDDIKENELLTDYKNELIRFYKNKIQPKVGAIVMNANPFTYGHRFLVEKALTKCDYLVVFVVEEDKSEIPFKDRFALVKKNLADLPNVFVRKSGEFIISSKTFSEYFAKESLQEQKIDTTLDVTLFAKEIAPCLNISVRFAGEEPTDAITRQYNEDMKRILPQYGIDFKEIKRKQTETGEIISASTVRKLAKAKEFDKLKALAPPSTIEYLKRH